jgi:hypothetical protein
MPSRTCCPTCGADSKNFESDPETGLVCTQCGTVVEGGELITDQLSFGKNANGAAVVVGSSNVGNSGINGRFRSGTTKESIENTIKEGESILYCLLNLS